MIENELLILCNLKKKRSHFCSISVFSGRVAVAIVVAGDVDDNDDENDDRAISVVLR